MGYARTAIAFLCLLCLQGVVKVGSTKGFGIPSGDITLHKGDNLTIQCHLNRSVLPNENFTFTRYNESLSRYVKKLNDSVIQLHMPNMSIDKDTRYHCRLEKPGNISEIVSNNVVYVGEEPANVRDFRCLGHNLKNYTCTWTVNPTYVDTVETLEIRFQGWNWINKTLNSTHKNGNRRSVTYSEFTTPAYRIGYNSINFRLNMTNQFGNTTQEFTMNHYATVIPDPPRDLENISSTTNSIMIRWKRPFDVDVEGGVHHRILYKWENGPEDWRVVMIRENERDKVKTYNITGLPFPNGVYDIRVSMLMAKADPSDEGMWSQNASITRSTKSLRPQNPPATTVGAFYRFDTKLYVYWDDIDNKYRNGSDFGYMVQKNDEEPISSNVSYAMFVVPRNTEAEYRVQVWCRNSEGESPTKSMIFVPIASKKVDKPSSFILVYLGDGHFKLQWVKPMLRPHEHLTNYTIFWCKNGNDRSDQCISAVKWKTVPGDALEYSISLRSLTHYQFAIAANTPTSTSGMVWAECTITSTGDPKMKNIYFSGFGDRYIDIQWSWGCGNASIHKNQTYIFEYCPNKETRTYDCIDSEPKRVPVVSNGTTARLENLTPSTTYKVNIYILKDGKEILQTTLPLFMGTSEAAPDQSPDVEVLEVTDSAIWIRWNATERAIANGELRNYAVECDGQKELVPPDTLQYKFENLDSYKNYNITVRACTSECSKDPHIISRTTLMAAPGEIPEGPVTNHQNASLLSILWKPANPPRGPINYYEVKVRIKNSEIENVFRVNTTSYDIVDCQEYDTVVANVRAVNIIDGTPVAGPWSTTFESPCFNRGSSPFIYVLIFGSVIVMCAVVYIGHKGYSRILVMKDVVVAMPRGLDIIDNPGNASDKWPGNDSLPLKPADEQPFLEFNMGRTTTTATTTSTSKPAERSQPSSGHGSGTPSPKSGGGVSTGGDSGTDQKEDYVEDRLRKRTFHVAADPAVPTSGYVSITDAQKPVGGKPPPPLSQAPASGYCKVGDMTGGLLYGTMDKKPPPADVPPLMEVVPSPKSGYVLTAPMAPPPATKDVDLLMGGVPPPEDIRMPHYVQAADPIGGLKHEMLWTNLGGGGGGGEADFAPKATTTPSGYVSVGDMPKLGPSPLEMAPKGGGYAMHRGLKPKSLKED